MTTQIALAALDGSGNPIVLRADQNTDNSIALRASLEVGGAAPGPENQIAVQDLAAGTALAAIQTSTAAGATAAGQASMLAKLNGTLAATIGSASTAGDSTITAGGTAQALFGGTSPVNGWKVANPHPTEDLWVADNGKTAAVNVGYRVFANGGQYATEPGEKPIGPISIFGATTGHAFTARSW